MNSGRIRSVCILIAYMIVSGSIGLDKGYQCLEGFDFDLPAEIPPTCIGSNKALYCLPRDFWWPPTIVAGLLPGEIHLSIYLDRDNEKNLDGKCFTDGYASFCKCLVSSSAYHNIYDLKFAITDALYNEYILGLGWRLRGKEENKYECLPGYTQPDANYHEFRYLLTEKQHLKSALESDGSYALYANLKATCFQRSGDKCLSICDSKDSYGSSWGYIYPPKEPKINWVKKSSTIKGDQFEFKFVSGGGDFPTNLKYHLFLYDNTGTGKPIRETIAYTSQGTQAISGGHVTMTIDLKDNCQYQLLLKATTRYTSEDTCNNPNSFLGDIYPNWKSNIQNSLGIALSRCNEDNTKCTEWTLYTGVTIAN